MRVFFGQRDALERGGRPVNVDLGSPHISDRGCAEHVHRSAFAVGGASVRCLPGGMHVRRDSQKCRPRPALADSRFGRRGVVSGLSAGSARRLRVRLAEVDWSACDSAFVTLTYHEEWGPTWQDWKEDYRRFYKRLGRAWGGVVRGGIWRLEFQRRGAPHYHLIVFFRYNISEHTLIRFRQWVARTWSDLVTASDDTAARRWGTDVRRVYNVSGHSRIALMSYMAKYMCKAGRGVDRSTGEIMETGRTWGIWGDIPERVLLEKELTYDELCVLMRRVRRLRSDSRYLGGVNGSTPGLLALGDGSAFVALLRGLGDGE